MGSVPCGTLKKTGFVINKASQLVLMNLLPTQEYLVVSSVPGLGSHLSHLGLKGHPPSRLDKQDPICPTLDLQVIPAAIPPHTWDSRWDRWDLFHVGLKRSMILGGMGRSPSVPPRIQRSSYLSSS